LNAATQLWFRMCADATHPTASFGLIRTKAATAMTRSNGRRGSRGQTEMSAHFGLSYPGAVQWLAAVENPPHLKAMVPAMTFATPRNFFYSGGVFDLSWLDWIWMNIAPDIRRRRNLSGPKTYEQARESWKEQHERLQNFL